MKFIDTHAHLDGDEFANDLSQVVRRAKDAGVSRVFLPCVNVHSLKSMAAACRAFPDYLYPMIGLQPEEVDADWESALDEMHAYLASDDGRPMLGGMPVIAIGEVGLDFYWTREHQKEQLKAFERQVQWAVETHLPLMIHCRKAQSELLHIMRQYEKELLGGVFHCFTGNQKEAEEYLRFSPKFCLGIGGVLTFKSSHLREDLPAAVPLSRIVLETDSPYMAPTPHRGERNESAYVALVLRQLAESYGVSEEEVARQTDENVFRIFKIRA